MNRNYSFSPPWRLHGDSGTALLLLVVSDEFGDGSCLTLGALRCEINQMMAFIACLFDSFILHTTLLLCTIASSYQMSQSINQFAGSVLQ
jgi:hypothetical protein